ncbi:MAG TPA: hypothetical protein VGH84_00755 [Steroidobacteraceae bacterium]
MIAADAARLREDPALKAILGDLEQHAVAVAISDFDPRARERGRTMALAISTLRQEIQDRIDTVLLIETNRQRALASE